MITVKLVENQNELTQILKLQARNHMDYLEEEVKASQGFVTVRHELRTLDKMHVHAPSIIASDEGIVIGYALVMTVEARNLIPVLLPLFDKIDSLYYQNRAIKDMRYYVMGQICIDAIYRGTGLFSKMYQQHKSSYKSHFDLCITEVDISNKRSIRAHEKIGFKSIHTYRSGGQDWDIIGWDWE